jgi:integrase
MEIARMPRRALTDRFCSSAKAREAEVQTEYFDDRTPGLALRVSRSGLKSWTYHFTLAGKRNRLTFGNYPAITLASARTRADEARAAVAEGTDPRSLKGETLRAICEEYQKREGNKLRSADWQQWALERYVYPTLGARPIGDIKRSEIVRWLDDIEAKAGPPMADRALATVRKIMNWYAIRSDDFRSPIVRGMTRSKAGPRERTLTDDELRVVWKTAGNAGVFGNYLRFLLLTAARKSEAADLEWSELTQADWTLPAARNKTKIDLVRPLSKLAQSILPEPDGKFVFTKGGSSINKRLAGYKHNFDILVLDELRKTDKAAKPLARWTLHDCRRTARSLMSRAGVPSDHAERCLGHVIGGVRGVYDRHEYHAEKAQAYEALAGIVERIVTGAQAGVVQLRGKR